MHHKKTVAHHNITGVRHPSAGGLRYDCAMDSLPNTKKPVVAAAEKPALPAPESEAYLASQAMPLGETVLMLSRDGVAIYGILHRSRAMTGQSDYFRLQFRGYAAAAGTQWQPFGGDDAQFHTVYNSAWVRADHPSRTATFGPKGGVMASETFRHAGLDTFLLAQVIGWIKGIYPDYAVSPGLVTLPATCSEDERLQRNAFFARQGFEFEWQDSNQKNALFFKDKVNKLLGVWDKEHITEYSGEAMLQNMAQQEETRAHLEQRVSALESRQTTLQQALQKERSTAQIMTGVVILILIIGMWAVL
ncbi:hypothetical protein [Pseudogulbenkiania ferrooxidans]|uniref:Transmembrane protein n=1 Tax=Pseudogulbenkiania ferrooxidans 2002 TaxID=279714 RepID=B9Z659_9NEIS|nr:hypothetical protein [Pseudogulbenkiania ferrooxidans]EEG07703.1 conserved hypothetical protein [Pseudogulbenkiania ferrooxidans 2002]